MRADFWIVWFLASAGVAKLLAIGENTIHGYGWRRPFLQRVRSAHNILLVSYPPALFLGLGWWGPRLLFDGPWSAVGLWGWAGLAIGAIGFVALIASTIRHLTYRPPPCEVHATSQVIDIAAKTAESLVGPGRAKWLARLPYNQQFTLEVQEKTYLLPQIPEAWDGLSIVHFSDVHFRGPVTRAYFEVVMTEINRLGGDVVAFTGDLLDHKACLQWIPDTFGRVTAPLGCYFVLGNHDWYATIDGPIRAALREHGWIDVSGTTVSLSRSDSICTISGTERPWMGTAPEFAAKTANELRMLLSHGPDQFAWAQKHTVDLMLAGHTHGGQIRLPLLGPVYSPSIHSCRYASGVFAANSTLMSVTRGVSGREPIRYNCRPEITKLILRKKISSNQKIAN